MKKLRRIVGKALLDLLKGIVRWIVYRNRLESKVDMMMRRLIRLEIVSAIQRKDTPTVCSLYDEYAALGGNSYITHMVEDYIKSTKRKKK